MGARQVHAGLTRTQFKEEADPYVSLYVSHKRYKAKEAKKMENMRDSVCTACAQLMFYNSTPNSTQRPFLQNLINEDAKAKPDEKAPIASEIMTKYLDQETKQLEVNGSKESMARLWVDYYILICDGWTGPTR